MILYIKNSEKYDSSFDYNKMNLHHFLSSYVCQIFILILKNMNVNGEGSVDFNIKGDKNVIQVFLTR